MRRAALNRRRALSWVTVISLSALGLLQIVGHGADASTGGAVIAPADRISQSIEGSMATVSADGSVIAYVDDTSAAVQVLDRRAGVTTDLTADVGDVQPGVSRWPTVSADGCTVTIVTELALDRFRDDDTGDRFDVYLQRLPQCGGEVGDWELVSVALDGASSAGLDATAGDDVSADETPAVSADGTVVAYERTGVDADAAGVVLVDLTVASGDPGRTTFLAGAHEPALDGDGSTLAYVLDGAVVVANVALLRGSVVMGDDAGTSPAQVIAPRGGDPVLSGDGESLAFVSDDGSLVPNAVLPDCTVRCVRQVYVRDLVNGITTLGSRVPGDPLAPPVGADADALEPVLGESDDALLFVTRATNLFPSRSAEFGAPDEGDVVLATPAAGTAVRLSTLADGITPAPATNAHPSLSPTARVVLFDHRDVDTGGRQINVLDLVPHLELADLDVGTAAVGENGPEWFVQVANDGPSAFVPHTVSIDDPNFVITGGSCVDLADLPVAPGASCSVLVRMSPTTAGLHTGRLTVAERGDDAFAGVAVTASSLVRGVGGLPAIETLPGGGDAGVVQVGSVGESLQFDVLNVGREPVQVSSVALQGQQALDFLIVADECTGRQVRAAARCSVEVAFAPGRVGGTGRRTASVAVMTAAGTAASFLVSGTAYYAPVLTTSLDPIVTGSRVIVGGSGFSPSTAVTVLWADGTGATTTVFTDANGVWSATLLVRATDRVGHRTLVAQTIDGQVASLPVQVVATGARRAPNAPTWPSP